MTEPTKKPATRPRQKKLAAVPTRPAVLKASRPPGPPVSKAWAPFTEALAAVLAVLENDQFLILSSKYRNHWVGFDGQGRYGMRAEAISNAYLKPEEALSEEQMAHLERLGWLPPSGPPEETNCPEKCPDGSPNFFREWDPPIPAAEIAGFGVTTLREVFGIPHPAHLVYTAYGPKMEPILLPSLRLEYRPEPEDEPEEQRPPEYLHPKNQAELLEVALETLRSSLGVADLVPDKDGDIPVRSGSTAVFVRVMPFAPVIELFSPLLVELPASEGLLAELNELNGKYLHVRFSHAGDTVMATVHLVADPFVPGQLTEALQVLAQLGDSLDNDLQTRFGGELFFNDEPRPKPDREKAGYN